MIKDGEAKVLEFNTHMGDPEAQPLLFKMETDPVPLMVATLEGGLGNMTIEWAPEDAVCVVMAWEKFVPLVQGETDYGN